MKNNLDILIIGGGINGTAIAADAAGRGLKVVLCEMNDLASEASSASTKLIHGGLRYLELYEFSLVREALLEREILMRRAPYLIKPLEFILPYRKQHLPAWLIRVGLFIYDHLAKRKSIPSSYFINFKNKNYADHLVTDIKKGFVYYDCMTDDSRLVILNALLAKDKGAAILTRTQFISAEYENNLWEIKLKDLNSNAENTYYAKALVNVSGRFIHEAQNAIKKAKTNFKAKLVKGSHIVVPKLYEGNFAYILPCTDKRVVFAIPYQQNFTLIGTTDVSFANSETKPTITNDERLYLIHVINSYFKKSIKENDVVWTYAGVRCLQDEEKSKKLSKISRDYKLVLATDKLPLLTVVGGKLTTHRSLAEEALNKLSTFFPNIKPAWTADSALPGWNFKEANFIKFLNEFLAHYSLLPHDLLTRLANSYGLRAYQLLKSVNSINDLGKHYGHGLYKAEVDYLIQHEWAQTVEDILWRRTKLGLLFSVQEILALKEDMALPT